MAVVFTDLAEMWDICDVESGYRGRGRVMCQVCLGKGCSLSGVLDCEITTAESRMLPLQFSICFSSFLHLQCTYSVGYLLLGFFPFLGFRSLMQAHRFYYSFICIKFGLLFKTMIFSLSKAMAL